jgi:SCP-2 sterol transfer family
MPGGPVALNPGLVTDIETFFDRLARREHEVRLEDIRGTVRIDIRPAGTKVGEVSAGTAPPEGGAERPEVDHWIVRLEHGDIGVAHEEAPADCVVRTDEVLFGQLVRGEENTITALLRGAMLVEGDLFLLISFERLLPAPPGTRDPRGRYQEAFR